MSVEADGRHVLELLSPTDCYQLLKKTIADYLDSHMPSHSNRIVSYESHDGHRLYYNVVVTNELGRKKSSMLDLSPDRQTDRQTETTLDVMNVATSS